MKKISIILCLILIISMTACSQTEVDYTDENDEHEALLSERLSVPEYYENELTSENGNSTLIIKADVTVPDVYDVDTVSMKSITFTDAQVTEFAKMYTDDTSISDWKIAVDIFKGEWEEWNGDFPLRLNPQSTNDENIYMLRLRSDDMSIDCESWIDAYGNLLSATYMSYENSIAKNSDINNLVELTNDKANSCTIDFETAKAYADEALAGYDEFELSFYGQNYGGEENSGSTDLEVALGGETEQYYLFYYTREIQGVPVNYSANSLSISNEFGFTAGLEYIAVMVNDDGVIAFEYSNPFEMGDIVEQNVDLISFDEAMEVFENIAMLYLKSGEAYTDFDKNVMKITDIRFGYMQVKQPNSEEYVLTPVWDFYGESTFVYDDSAEYFFELYDSIYCDDVFTQYTKFTISAVDGTVIDRDLGY